MADSQAALAPGFADPALDSQRVFRAVLDAMARPGSVHVIPVPDAAPAPLQGAAAALCLCLADLDTPLWVDPAAQAAAAYLRFHTGCPVTDQPEKAAFALITDPGLLPDLARFAQGDPEYPERSTTLIVQVPNLVVGAGWVLKGPGIDGTARLAAEGFAEGFPNAWAANGGRYPQGVDMVLTAGNRVAGLPRTVQLEG